MAAKLSTGSPIEQLGRSIELDATTGKTLHEIENVMRCSALAHLASASTGFSNIKQIVD
jgi:predicted amidophosphoribosyltransferase